MIWPSVDQDNVNELPLHAAATAAEASTDPLTGTRDPTVTFIDLTDLLLYLRDRHTLSGIQRVQCEIARSLVELDGSQDIRFLTLDSSCKPYEIETFAFLNLIGYISSTPVVRAGIDQRLDAIFSGTRAAKFRRDDRFVATGAFWAVPGAGIFLQALKNAGVVIGLYIHDIMNITHPEYFTTVHTNKYIKSFVEAELFADFILTSSYYNKTSLTRHWKVRGTTALPVEVVPLGHELLICEAATPISRSVEEIAETEFVLAVGTIEVRKNPTYLFNIWKIMLEAGRKNVPKLVLAGRSGWMVQDFFEQLHACHFLGGKIVLLHDVSDVELTLLYQKCLLTIFPSLVEGWGLPVGESLARGKICIASSGGGIPEVAGSFADYVDPYNASEGLRVLGRYLDDPDLRRKRECEIAERFKPRLWRDVAENFLNSVQTQAAGIQTLKGVAAVKLPANRFLPITIDGSNLLVNAIDGDLSADLICVSGWRLPGIDGAWAEQPSAIMRFRAVAPAGSAITLVMRLRAGNGGCRLRIRSGSGSETEVSLSDSVDGVAVLACVVETDDLVTATLSLQGARPGSVADGASYWALKGILYVWSGLQIDANGSGGGDRPRSSAVRSTLQAAVDPPHPDGPLEGPARIDVAPVLMDVTRARASIDAFVSSTDCYWSSIFPGYKGAPILADQTDKQMFYNAKDAVVGPTSDKMTLFRRSNQWVSMTRFSEGTIFDAMGVSRGIGYLQGAPDHPWLSRNNWGAAWISKEAFSAAPYYDKSYLIFYNGNLHNYYHWVIEGLLPLYVLSQAFGPSFNVHVALPRSRHINAVFDHRASLDAVGLGGYDITEIPEDLVKVREAIWVESDLIENMPAPFLRDFQRAVAAIHTRSRLRKKRRVLVLRKGPTRTIVNIKRVRSFLSSHGFESIYLEGMSVTDQIVLFQNAEFIVSPHGAGLSNLVFCEPGTKVIEFMPMVEMRPFFWLISEKLGLVHGMLFSKAADVQAPMTIDIDRLEAIYRMVNAHR